jgi:hypothetical protein
MRVRSDRKGGAAVSCDYASGDARNDHPVSARPDSFANRNGFRGALLLVVPCNKHTQEEIPMSALDDLLRLRFLETVYDTTHGDRFQDTNVALIAPAVGLSAEAADHIAQYLVDEGLLAWLAFGGVISITHAGVKEVEQARREPEKRTQHFPPINYIHIEHMTDSQLQQGTRDSVQQMSQTMSPEQIDAVAKWLDAIRAADLGVAADLQAEVDVQLATIEAQAKSARPRNAVLKAAARPL